VFVTLCGFMFCEEEEGKYCPIMQEWSKCHLSNLFFKHCIQSTKLYLQNNGNTRGVEPLWIENFNNTPNATKTVPWHALIWIQL